MFVPLKSSILACLLLWTSTGVEGALITLNEPAVRVITVGSAVDPVNFDMGVTITDDDGTTALAADSFVFFNLIVEFDASLVFPRTAGPDLSSRISQVTQIVTTVNGVIDYTITPFLFVGGVAFFQHSFKILISLESDPTSPTPTTVVRRSSSEVWLYNPEAYPPEFLIMNPANVPPKSGKDVYLFAIGTPEGVLGEDGDQFVYNVAKDDSGVLPGGTPLMLPSAFDPQTPIDQGRYWKLPGIRRSRRANGRFGQYVLLPTPYTGFSTLQTPNVFLNPASRHLDTRGRQTFTVYRRSIDSDILDEPLTFGVRRTSLSGSLRWLKDYRFLRRGRPTMTIRRTDQAGLYILQRKRRGRNRSWFVQILVTLSDCLRSELNFMGGCQPEGALGIFGSVCLNGGVTGQIVRLCQCPPCFRGAFCERLAPTGDPFSLAESKDFTCGDLPGGNEKCRGYKFCLGGNYGCTCGCGWHGQDCDRPCRSGFYGPDCSQKCNCLGSSCDRFTGECESAGCPAGFHGFNCQLPVSIPLGSPNEIPPEFAALLGGP